MTEHNYISNNDIFNNNKYIFDNTINNTINTLQAKCRTLTVERVYTTGFTITANQYEGIGPFTTVLHISYPAGANKTISIVQARAIGSDICVRDAILSPTGTVDLADYNVTDTHMIYAMINTVLVGTTTINCCTPLPSGGFDYTNCPTSNYILFTVTDTGNVQFLSNPSGAHIWLAPTGQTPTDTTQITPNTITGLPIGNYDYILKLTNYNNYVSSTPIIVVKNQTAVVGPIDLVPVEGCIYFISSPSGARIYLAQIGQIPIDTGLNTPNIICGKPLGDYIYKLTLTGYEDATDTITLISGHGEIVTKTLRSLPVLSDIIISPLNPSITVNTDQQFGATPLDQYGNPYPAAVAWSSSNTYVGIIDPNTGIFSALHTGTSIITASSSSVIRTTTITVTPLVPVLSTITVSPPTISIVANNAAIFTATTLDQFNNPISAIVTWSSSNPIVGMIDQNGVFLALSQGTTIITASSGTVSGIAVANVTPAAPVEIPVLTRITISPLATSLAVGVGTIFVASTLDQFGNSIYETVIWNSSDTNVGTIDQNGIFLAISPGITTITATNEDETISGVAIANVTPAIPSAQPILTRITLSPLTTSLIVGNGTIFTASTLDQFGNSIYAIVIWSSSNPAIGTIDQNGVFLAISPGITTITATNEDGTISGVAIANVTSAVPIIQPLLTRITLSPLTTSLIVGNGTIFVATTLDQFNNPIYTTLEWSSSDPTIGTINQNGVFLAISPGITTITASSEDGTISGVAIANVTSAVPTAQPILTKIIIEPLTTSLIVGNGTIFTASTLDQFGNSIYAIVTWNSSNTNIGTIDQNGVFLAISPGIVTITASNGSIVGAAIANVTPAIPTIQPLLTRITISPLATTIAINNSTVFVATTLDQFNNSIYTTLEWSSSNTNVGTIDQNGIFTAISPGTTTITASSGNISGVAIANVTPAVPTAQPILTKIIIEPLTTTILVNNSTVLLASTLDQFGNSTATIVTWSSSDTNVGIIDQNGIFSALNIGKTTITASSENIIGVALVNVVKSLPGPTGGILGNINTAALILGTAVVGAVVSYKGYKEKEIEKQAEMAKKEIDKAIEIERIREREMKLISK